MTAFIFINIFKILGPLSRYLQNKCMNLIKAQDLVNGALKDLKLIQRNFIRLKPDAHNFISNVNKKFDKHNTVIFVEKEFPKIRSRHRKKLFGEKTKDEPIISPEKKFMVEVYNVILDQTIFSIENKFLRNNLLYKDLNFLSPKNFEDLQNIDLPPNALKNIHEIIHKFDSDISYDRLRAEFHSFCKNWKVLRQSLPETFEVQGDESDVDYDPKDGNEITVNKLECKSCKNCVVCCFQHPYEV